MDKLATAEFIEHARNAHGDKYDYSKVEYINNKTKVCIICPKHGEFWQTPTNHIFGKHGCPKCRNERISNLRKEEFGDFVENAKKVHGDKYDYSKAEYIDSKTKVCIICPKHGEFWQKPNHHLRGEGCPNCNPSKKLTLDEFIEKANLLHKYKYDYSKVEYINSSTKVCIICPIHGEFWMTPNAHLRGQRCPYCYGNIKLDKEEFIKRAKQIHGEKYDYSKIEYLGYEKKVCIICKEHGEFWQTPHSHLSGQGCPTCYGNKKLTTEEFIERARKVHGDKYDYSNVEYLGNESKICIICPKHGEFWQTPHNHLHSQGCPYCWNSKLENEVELLLKNNGIEFSREKTFEWLKSKRHMYLDFYLPKQNIVIECQGEQHFESNDHFGGIEGFLKRNKLDSLKYRLCNEHGIKVLYYANTEQNEYFSKVYTNINDLINKINE